MARICETLLASGERVIVSAASEDVIAEIRHTRSLAKLGLSQLAPTVLASTAGPEELIATLRSAGYLPVQEDSGGEIVVESGPVERPSKSRRRATVRPNARLAASELVEGLRAAERQGYGVSPLDPDTTDALTQLNPGLDEASLALLSYAVEHQSDVVITYRNQQGNRSVRAIRPERLYGRWLDSWCHLRNDQRDFTVANIEAVAPVA